MTYVNYKIARFLTYVKYNAKSGGISRRFDRAMEPVYQVPVSVVMAVEDESVAVKVSVLEEEPTKALQPETS